MTKAQLDAMFRGLKWKNSVKVASTTNLTLSGTQTIDTVAVVAGDRVLAKDQSSASANGIYVVAAGAWTRATDFDDSVEVSSGARGSDRAGFRQRRLWPRIRHHGRRCHDRHHGFGVPRLGGSGVSYTAGANVMGLTLSGSAFSILLDTNSGLVQVRAVSDRPDAVLLSYLL